LTGKDVFRVTLTSFLDAHTFDTRQVMKCCLAHVLPSGHIIPFCAYNTLYRDGHVPLPTLKKRESISSSKRSLSLNVLS
jgi:7,8-dihydro-6-hydroxymethylpterin dimethyltransferase